MRPELTTLEQIDMYLSGKLSPAEHGAFEAKINADPNLQNMVSQQKELIKAVNRKALRAQINAAAAAAGGGMSNLWIGISSVVGIGLIAAALIYFNTDDDVIAPENDIAINATELEETDSNTIDFDAVEEILILEEPETIFSSVHNYDEELGESRTEVTIDGLTQNEPNEIDINLTENGSLVEVIEDPSTNEVNQAEIVDNLDRTRRANYPGGNYAMDQFIDKNLHYPRSARNKKIEGVVRCDFFVTADGVLTEIDAKCIKMNERDGQAFNDVKLLMNKKVMNAFINNATHILRTMPNWEPATNSQGNPILSAQRMYFNYDLVKGCLVYQLDDEPEIEIQESVYPMNPGNVNEKSKSRERRK